MTNCTFCNTNLKIIVENKHCFAIYDLNPVSPGHILIITKRHITNFFETNPDEAKDIHELILKCKNILDEKFKPDGYNIGTNIGEYGGQSIFHMHIHLMPRYKGDTCKHRGGVRCVIPLECPYL